jgi:hypothetical protein
VVVDAVVVVVVVVVLLEPVSAVWAGAVATTAKDANRPAKVSRRPRKTLFVLLDLMEFLRRTAADRS